VTTSRLMGVKFTGTESTFAYFEALREYLERYGKPLALYSDKGEHLPGKASRPSQGQEQLPDSSMVLFDQKES
jgi:hypothetical protein